MSVPEPQTAPETREVSRLTAILLAVAALGWTAAMLQSARASITSRADAAMEVTSTAYALPGAVSAAMVCGAAVALLALTLIARRRPLGATTRFAVATGAGLLVGVLCALPIISINTEGTIYAAVGGTVAAAATIGGALAGFRVPPVIAGAGSASVAVFVLGFLVNKYLQNPVLDAFGAGSTAEMARVSRWFAFGQSALGGLTAGLMSYAVLRRARRRAGDLELRWPFYALAGAGPGALLVLAEILTRTAGAQVLQLAGKVSELEQSVQQMLSTSRLNGSMIVLFLGAISAIIAVGRTLSPADDPQEQAATDEEAMRTGEEPTRTGETGTAAGTTPTSRTAPAAETARISETAPTGESAPAPAPEAAQPAGAAPAGDRD
ncbi:hypothetical protein [Actinoplanes teichomyceticus]|uniref:Uncharacterized protein n=1 Tax=Actinoplanes teichomyceticus TaxID=1867 RepID=A0A561VGT0_ACTTI|nr:hypothetical protein [Actinoplanes teichomyceticus]TWG10830.1 hypothetical protein FHX34_107328 [Actinoplanes teichomyceticus]GIF12549.1 hypothetical protein Ate01nite_25810 [Actinoplanes teichomyceticus]